MLKDNHIWACKGSITAAVKAAKKAGGFTTKVEVECQSEDEAIESIRAGADVVMLDNFTASGIRETAAKLKDRFNNESREPRREFLIEVSGGLTEDNIEGFVCPEVDIISTSAIHQGVKHVDFSLKIIQYRIPT